MKFVVSNHELLKNIRGTDKLIIVQSVMMTIWLLIGLFSLISTDLGAFQLICLFFVLFYGIMALLTLQLNIYWKNKYNLLNLTLLKRHKKMIERK